jgi:hypothetical protein
MKHLILLAAFITIGAYAEAPPKSTTAKPGTEKPSTGDEPSEVLAHKEPNAIKCPKHAKLVKGKCLMQIEETGEE